MSPRRTARAAPDLDLFVEPEPPPASREYGHEPPEPIEFDRYPGETPQSAIPVSLLNQTAKEVLEGAFVPLWVRGEISDFKSHRNGHWYFCLRDARSQIRAVVWSRDQRGIPAAPDDGMQVVALGRLGVYASRGEMQFSVTRIEAEGDGLRRKALEITRTRLEADGLLAPERKRPLPMYPRVIAVVTSLDGAALHDIVAVMRRRAANVRLVIVPAAVQGATAVDELCRAMHRVNRWGGADLVIIGRGGGSRDDLWAFNDERVARAVAACAVPTISAVGHEIDFSMCDLVADHRAPTPSAAAEAATRSRQEMEGALRKLSLRLGGASRALVRESTDRARHLGRDLAAAGQEQLARRRAAMGTISSRLHALSPIATMSRGYAVPRGTDGTTLRGVDDFADGAPFDLIVRDGVVPSVTRGSPRRNAP